MMRAALVPSEAPAPSPAARQGGRTVTGRDALLFALAGFALFFTTYSTFLTRPGLYLEDLYVQESARGQGIGSALLRRVFELAKQREAGRLEWAVLDWNSNAIAFYERMGAEVLPDWRICRASLSPRPRSERDTVRS